MPSGDRPSSHPASHHRNLEDSFFGERRAELRRRLRETERTRIEQMETLAEISGIGDVEVLEKLVALGVRSETLAALTLYPLVAVAWADGKVDRHERDAVLRAARECGLKPEGISYDLLASWLDQQPDAVLLAAWTSLVREICRQAEPEWRVIFAQELLTRAGAVADASGGFLALDKTSDEEQVVLDQLRAAFE